MVAFDRVGSPAAALEAAYEDLDQAITALGRHHPTWGYGDVLAKAEALTQFDVDGVPAVLTGNGDWDGGLASLADPAAAGARFRLVRGDPATGGLVPDAAAASFADRIGSEHVITIPRGAHSPMRDPPAATLAALLGALQP